MHLKGFVRKPICGNVLIDQIMADFGVILYIFGVLRDGFWIIMTKILMGCAWNWNPTLWIFCLFFLDLKGFFWFLFFQVTRSVWCVWGFLLSFWVAYLCTTFDVQRWRGIFFFSLFLSPIGVVMVYNVHLIIHTVLWII